MKVFIENEAGQKLKNIFSEKTMEFQKTIEISASYPYPYGFILNTTGEDGDNLDVFILTDQKLKKGEIIDVEIIGLMEQFEKSWDLSQDREEVDHNVLAKLKNDPSFQFDETTKNKLREFVLHVFDNIRKNKTRVGEFLSKEEANQYIKSNKDN